MLLIAMADGSRMRELVSGRPATHPAWRPPDGAEILFMDDGSTSGGYGGLYAVSEDGRTVRIIFEPASGRYRDLAAWSPDGSQIAYMEWTDGVTFTSRIHIIGADGTGDRVLPMPPGAVWENIRSWSNDGTRLLGIRGYTGGWGGSVAVARPVDGSGFGVEFDLRGIEDGNCCSVWEWAPDDASILGTPTDAKGGFLDQLLLDPATGTSTAVPWTTSSHPTWQRLAN
jgi:tricorn protease-like protein